MNLEVTQHLQRAKQTGKPVVGCLPLYPPVELLHSFGLQPVVLWGIRPHLETANRHLQVFTCAPARYLTEFLAGPAGTEIDALLVYNACDTLRNMPEIIQRAANRSDELPFFRLHVPMKEPETELFGQYIGESIGDLIDSLEKHYDKAFDQTQFEKSVSLYSAARGLCRKLETAVASGAIPFADFCQTVLPLHWMDVQDFIEKAQTELDRLENPADPERGEPFSRTTMLSGILPPTAAISLSIEAAGFRVMTNDIAALGRSYGSNDAKPAPPADYYRNLYGGHSPCSTLLYTTDDRADHLVSLAKESKADSIIFLGEKFCECEFFEFPYLIETLRDNGIESLLLELSAEDIDNIAAYSGRIEAFAEMLGDK